DQGARRDAMRRRTICALALAAPALVGCGGDHAMPGPPHHVATLAAGDFTLRVDADALDVSLVHGDTVLLDLPADALELGPLTALDDTPNYHPIPLVAPTALHPAPDDLAWLKPDAMSITSSSATSIVVALTYPSHQTATLTITAPSAGSFRASLV